MKAKEDLIARHISLGQINLKDPMYYFYSNRVLYLNVLSIRNKFPICMTIELISSIMLGTSSGICAVSVTPHVPLTCIAFDV